MIYKLVMEASELKIKFENNSGMMPPQVFCYLRSTNRTQFGNHPPGTLVCTHIDIRLTTIAINGPKRGTIIFETKDSEQTYTELEWNGVFNPANLKESEDGAIE
jgi:hypothetical protein